MDAVPPGWARKLAAPAPLVLVGVAGVLALPNSDTAIFPSRLSMVMMAKAVRRRVAG
jgi:hypothetical protein